MSTQIVTSQFRKIHSPWLGDVDSDPRCELLFPLGLPGFEQHRRMMPVEIPAQRPLLYLQSLEASEVCFVTLPVYVVDRGFQLHISDEELTVLELPDDREPVVGEDVLCLALLAPFEGTVQANLDAAIVINLHNRRGVQCLPQAERPAGLRRLGDGGWTALC